MACIQENRQYNMVQQATECESKEVIFMSYDIAYMWNLKKGYKWAYLQNRNRVTDVKNKLMVTGGGGAEDKSGDRKSVGVGKECRSRWSPYH